MDLAWWQITLIVLLGSIALVLAAALATWWLASRRTKTLAARVKDLPWRRKISLARSLVIDERVPLLVRLLLPALVLYLALPIDLIPDFVPVVGQVDDVLVLVVGIVLLVKLTPGTLLEEHLAREETAVLDERAIEAERPSRTTLPPGS